LVNKNNFKYRIDHTDIAKIEVGPNLPTIDIYFSDLKVNNINDVIWTNIFPFKTLLWKDVTLYLPNKYETNLINRYGTDWKTPKKSKGNQAKATHIHLVI
jgi:hypothetical protein